MQLFVYKAEVGFETIEEGIHNCIYKYRDEETRAVMSNFSKAELLWHTGCENGTTHLSQHGGLVFHKDKDRCLEMAKELQKAMRRIYKTEPPEAK